MDLKQLRKLAGLPSIMETTVPNRRIERDLELLAEKIEKINVLYWQLHDVASEFQDFLQSRKFETGDMIDAVNEAIGNLENFQEMIENSERELETLHDELLSSDQ